MAEQLGLELPSAPALGRADFLIAPSNATALAQIENWQSWPSGKLILCGPEGSGKTHLAHVWANATGAQIYPAGALSEHDLARLAQGPCVVEDVPLIAGSAEKETALFHFHNLMQAEGQPLLLTGTGRVSDWGIALPDLASRLASTAVARLEAPDDTLLAALLAKLFADRQLSPAPEVITYLVRRIDRSFAAARDIVDALDAASLAQKRPVTRTFAQRLLDKNN